jgi:hypothetical protein
MGSHAHTHAQGAHEHPGENRTDPRAYTLTIVGLVSVILTIVSIIGLEALYFSVFNAETENKVYAVESANLSAIRSQQLETIHSYRWVDREKGVVAIPISQAAELVVKERASAKGG